MSRIVDFYGGAAADDQGRFLRDMLAWPDSRLEAVHNYIQWMFPLPERSPVNPGAPILDRETIAEFHAREDLRENLRAGFRRMLKFYGLEMAEGNPARVARGANFEAAASEWLWPGNHNHLRITRILRCTRLLGLEAESRAFFECLSGIYEEEKSKRRPGITAESFAFWAANAPPA